MTANELLRNSTIRRAHYIEMFKNNDVRRILLMLNAVDSDLQKQILARAGKSYNMTSRRLELMQQDVRESVALGKQILSRSMNETALEFSKEEINWTIDAMTKAIPSPVAPQFVYPSATQVLASIKATPYSNTTMQQFIKGWADNKLSRFNNALKLGFLQGKGIEDIARGLFGTRALQYKDGLADMSRREIRTGVRTAINHFSQTAREETYKANEEFVKGIQWVSTLDARTTLICIGLDGKIDLFDESVMELNGQRPPIHFNCRSTTVPVLKSLKELGLSEREFSTSTRASMNGQVSQKETYSSWFAKQDEKFQRSVLGKGRYELYKSGEIKLDGFADNGRTMTLAQLGKTAKQEPTFTRNYDSDVAKKLGKGNYNELHDIIEKSDNKDAINLYNKYESKINIKDKNHSGGGAYFNPSDEKIVFNIEKDRTGSNFSNPYQTFVHESGHAIDYKLGKNYDGGLYYSQGYNNNEFGKAIRSDVDTWAKSYKDEMLPEIVKHMESKEYGAIWDKYGENIDLSTVIGGKKEYNIQWGYNRISRELDGLPHKSLTEISDIVAGATDGKCKVIIGHGEEYWRHKGMLETEAFAEMLSATITNKGSLNVLKKYLPNAYSVFEKMIKGVL